MFAARNTLLVKPPTALPVSTNSTGSGFAVPENFSPLSRTFTITIAAGSNRRMYVPVFVGHDAWMNSYTGPTVTSNLGGTYSIISGPIFLGNISGWPQGAMWILRCTDPPVGAQTLTVGISAGQYMKYFAASGRCYNNVGSEGTIVTQAYTSTAGPLNLSLTAPTGGMNLVAFGCNGVHTLTGASTSADLWFSASGNEPGDIKYVRSMDLAGDGTTKTFTSTNTDMRLCSIGLPLNPVS